MCTGGDLYTGMRPLAGLELLLVEASTLVAMDSQDGLLEAGARSVEIVNSPERALQRLRQRPVDAAIVDVDLECDDAVRIAEAIVATGVPLVVASSYSVTSPLPATLAAVPLVPKPYLLHDLIAALADVLARQTVRRSHQAR